MRRFLGALLCGLVPAGRVKNQLLRFLGWRVDRSARIGHSVVFAERIWIGANTAIGHGNFVSIYALSLAPGASIAHMNRVRGPLLVALSENASIGSANQIIRGGRGVSWGRAKLKLGTWSNITAEHIIDCTRSVIFGDFSTLAGRRSQIWTHGYVHGEGLDRFRVDGAVRVGNGVYVGSAAVINAGVAIANDVTIGSSACVSRSIDRAGLYVSQPLRMIEKNYLEARSRYNAIEVEGMRDVVRHKRP